MRQINVRSLMFNGEKIVVAVGRIGDKLRTIARLVGDRTEADAKTTVREELNSALFEEQCRNISLPV